MSIALARRNAPGISFSPQKRKSQDREQFLSTVEPIARPNPSISFHHQGNDSQNGASCKDYRQGETKTRKAHKESLKLGKIKSGGVTANIGMQSRNAPPVPRMPLKSANAAWENPIEAVSLIWDSPTRQEIETKNLGGQKQKQKKGKSSLGKCGNAPLTKWK